MSERIDEATAIFVAHRNLLFTVAYEMLGAAADAEDVVQETWLRWARVDRSEVRDDRAYLVRIATRQALDRLRMVQRRRESYVGPWLPEPLLTAPDVAENAELAESVSLALMVVLETLAPTERAVFVLREAFGFGYDEIATAVEKSPAAVRQIAHRARAHVEARRPRERVTTGEVRVALDRFRIAVETGDPRAILEVLAPDVVLMSDGGGVITAAVRPILGAERVMRFTLGVIEKAGGVVTTVASTVNGNPALLLKVDGAVDGVLSAIVADGRIAGLYYVRNPHKLTRLGAETRLASR